MKNPRIYVVLNGELEMSPGKAAAQAVHSVMLLNGNSKQDFVSDYLRTVIVVEAKNAEQIRNLAIYLDEASIDSDYYIDEGANEVDAYSVTALAAFVGDNEEDYEKFESFPLFSGKKQYSTLSREAFEVLREVTWQNKDGFRDNNPRYVEKTLKWLREQ